MSSVRSRRIERSLQKCARRVQSSQFSDLANLDLVARYLTLKKRIYSMADDLHARSEDERYFLGKLLKQPFSEQLSMFNLLRRELDTRSVNFNDLSQWPELYSKH